MSVAGEVAGDSAATVMPLYLCSVLGTLLFFDEASGQVRHGGISEVPQNLAYVSAGGWNSLAVLRGGKWEKLTVGSRAPGLSPAGSTFDLGRSATKGIVLSANKNVVYFDVGGSIRFEAAADGADHADLYPLTHPELDYLRHFLGHDWRSATNGGVVRSGAISLKNDFLIRIGTIEVRLSILLSKRDARTKYQKSITLRYDGWKLERLVLYRPVIYFTAFGRTDIFTCLDLALRSLAELGSYEGDLLVLTDKTPEEFGELVAFRPPRLMLVQLGVNDRLDISLARYVVPDLTFLEQFQPLLYLDTDVLCVAPIAPALDAVLRAAALCLTTEQHDLLSPEDWFGGSLFRDDPTAVPRLATGLNTGVLGLPSVDAVRDAFVAIRDHTEPVAGAKGDRNWCGCYDQAVANYVLHKGFAFDVNALAGVVGLSAGIYDGDVIVGESLLIHFLGGFGHAAPKAVRMRALFDRLVAGKASPDSGAS